MPSDVRVMLLICAAVIINSIIQLARFYARKESGGAHGKQKLTDGFNPDTTIIDMNNSWTMYRDYGGEIRCIDGKPLKTQEDWERWWVLKGFADAMRFHLSQLEKELIRGEFTNVQMHKSEWRKYYARYRELCVRHGIWNGLLEERERFIPTKVQLAKEEALYRRIDHCALGGESRKKELEAERREYENLCSEVINYIGSQYRHTVIRQQMINTLSGGNAAKKSMLQKTCKRMVRDNLLTESKNPNGRYIVRKKRKTTPKPSSEMKIPAKSIFSKELYALVPKKTLYKVEYTVNAPINVDREKGYCDFISKSSGTRYHTSFSECTCPAFTGNGSIPCKHMTAFAIYLGYYKPE